MTEKYWNVGVGFGPPIIGKPMLRAVSRVFSTRMMIGVGVLLAGMGHLIKLVLLSMLALELILVPAIGGRMMDIRYQGESLLFQNPDLQTLK